MWPYEEMYTEKTCWRNLCSFLELIKKATNFLDLPNLTSLLQFLISSKSHKWQHSWLGALAYLLFSAAWNLSCWRLVYCTGVVKGVASEGLITGISTYPWQRNWIGWRGGGGLFVSQGSTIFLFRSGLIGQNLLHE